jgi:RNA polymerase sigma-70 factor, ECF subfamily
MSDDRDAARIFDELFVAHYSEVLGYILRRVALSCAEDVLAETFLVAWRRADSVPDDALPWLLGVARRALANQRRGDLRRRALTSRLKARSAQPQWESPAVLDCDLADALAALPERQREALLLSAWEGLDARRGAAAAGCSPAAFRVRLHRARSQVAAKLATSTLSPSFPRPSEDMQ